MTATLGKHRALIITGMHRSGTSLVANLLQHAGVPLGEELIVADDGNRYGYFEDVDFHRFHEDVLGRLQRSYLVQGAPTLGGMDPEERVRAQQLIETRSSRDLWGFKDPRTCLFLEFWHGLLPQAGYVFVYRHPVEVVLSLLRRGKEFDLDALVDPLAALRSWETHNRSLLEFRRRHPRRCVLGHISTIAADTERFVLLVAKKLRVPLRAEGTQSLYHSEALRQLRFSTDTDSLLHQVVPDAMKLYRLLEKAADLPSRPTTKVAERPVSPSRTLRSMASKVANDVKAEDRTAHVFQVLLTALKPEWVLAGKAALDKIRSERIGTLETKVGNREQLLAARRVQLDSLRARARDLEQRVARQEGHLTGLTAHLEHLKMLVGKQQEQLQAMYAQAEELDPLALGNKELRRRLAVKEEQLQEQTSRLQQQTARVADQEKRLASKSEHVTKLESILARKEEDLKRLTAHAETLEQVAAGQQAQTQDLQDKVTMIEASRVWRLAQKWYAFKFSLGIKPKPRLVGAAVGEESVASRAPELEPSPAGNEEQGGSGPPKVLFISHDARPHGAQILLLHLLKWLKANSDIPFQVLLKEGGLLRPQFEALAPVSVWNESYSGLSKGAHGRIGNGDRALETQLKRANIGLIYSNTITNGKVLDSLAGLDCPVICHVHELEYCLNYQTEQNNNRQIKKLATHYIAVSQAVKRGLMQNLKIRENQIDVVYEFIPTQNGLGRHTNARDRIRRKLKIPQDASIVGACGTTDWRKGPDLFIQLARFVHERQAGKPVHFIWVGGETEGPRFAALWHDVKHMNLEDYVHFTGAVRNPMEYFSTFDVFCLTSREDPYPLVNLEVASLGTPIVCFDDSGGAKEFVEDDCGFVVPYLDLDSMAAKVSDLLGRPEMRRRLGQRAAAKVRERHDLEDTAPQILRIIESLLSPTRSAQQLMK